LLILRAPPWRRTGDDPIPVLVCFVKKEALMPSNREIVTNAFTAWSAGTGYVTSIFADDMTWEIVGRSAVSRKYATTKEFVDEVLHPFGQRFRPDAPFKPVTIRGIYADGDTVIVLWDGVGTTLANTTYRNTYAWFLTLANGKVVDGVAVYDSIAFNELWAEVIPPS
jgi:ketosteroid isomerase-like protein